MAYLSLRKQFNYNKSHKQTHRDKVVLSKGQIDVIRRHMDELSFKRKNGELEVEFFRRFYNYLKLDIVDEINLERSGFK